MKGSMGAADLESATKSWLQPLHLAKSDHITVPFLNLPLSTTADATGLRDSTDVNSRKADAVVLLNRMVRNQNQNRSRPNCH